MSLTSDSERARREVVQSYLAADPVVEAALSEACRLATVMLGCPAAAVEIVGGDHVHVSAAIGVEPGRRPRAGSLADRVLWESKAVIVEDAAADPRFADGAFFAGPDGVRFFASTPLISPEGAPLGVFRVWDVRPRQVEAGQRESLEGLGRLVLAQLNLQRRQRQLETLEDRHARVEAALREAEAKYRGIFENNVVGIYQTTPDGRYLTANPTLARIYGYTSPLELMGGIGDIEHQLYVDPGARDRFQAALQQEDTISDFEAEIRRKDGKQIWILENARVVRDSRGAVEFYEGTVQDITVRKKAQEQLSNAERLYHSLVEDLPQNIFRKDKDEQFIFANTRFCTTVGRPLEEILKRTDYDLYSPELARQYQADDQRVMAEGRTVRVTERNVAADGSVHWVEVIKTPLHDVNGQTIGIQGIFWDVTETKRLQDELEYERDLLREAEEKYRNMVENSVEGIYQTSPDGRFLSVNPAIVRIYKYGSKEELLAHLTDVGRQVYLEPGRREEFTAAVLGAGSVTGFESEVRCGDGSTIWISESARPVRDRDGNLLYFEGSLEDISARKQIDEEREKTRKAAIESARLKAEFLATVSHEIRTPLNAIVPNAAMLTETPLDLHQKYLVESIDHGARMLLQIVNDVLDFTRVDAGALRLEEIDFDLLDTVERALGAFAGLALQRHLELIGDFHPGLPRRVRGDPSRLGQILNNLLGNALKFTSSGEVSLRVEPGTMKGDRLEIRFSVRDTGIGIAADARSRVFQAFAQADGSMSRRYGGTGLGLAITRGYVELMGGEIDFDSELGRGTTFRFGILVGVSEAGAGADIVDGEANPLPLAGQRVLVLDDNPAQLRVLAEAMEGVGAASVHPVGDLPSAVEQLGSAASAGQPVDLVFFDPSVSGKTTEWLADELRKGAAGCRLIAVVPPGAGGRDRSLEKHGVIGFLIKPLRRSRLAEELTDILAGRRNAPAAGDAPSGGGPANAPGRGCRVLLVEDNPLNQRVAVQLLERLEASVDAVGNGVEALRAFQERDYDLILMDCQMPGMDGCETTRRIRQLEAKGAGQGAGPGSPRVPIVALSANAFSDDRERGLASGMDDYLTKPLSQPELVRVFERVRSPRPAAPGSDGPPAGTSESGTPVLDPAPLLALASPEDPSIANEFIGQFLAEAPGRVERLAALAAAGESARVRTEAHTLKGNASYMGARRLVEALSALEAAGLAVDGAALVGLAATVQAEFERARGALVAFRAGSGPVR